MKRKRTAWILGGALLLLLCALGTLVFLRLRGAKAVVQPEAALENSVTEALQAKPTPEPAPTPTPTPTPTPAPTPRPLREVSICEANLDRSLFEPAAEQGRVELVQYLTHDHVSDESVEIMKDLAVYLPYGYDETKQYDVLVLLHCAGADHRFWLVENREYRIAGEGQPPSQYDWTLPGADSPDGNIPVYVPDMLDRMIEEGWCRPLIVVSPCIYLYDRQPSSAGTGYDYVQFTREYGPDLMAYVAEHYATYAADGSRESLAKAREHFGLLGASFGAYAEYLCVIGDNFDLAAWYTFCGGGAIDPGGLMQSWQLHGTQDLPLKLLYISEGEYDDRAGPEGSYNSLLYYGEYVGGPFNPENVRFTLIRGWGHEDHSYLVGLFNTLQLFFRE